MEHNNYHRRNEDKENNLDKNHSIVSNNCQSGSNVRLSLVNCVTENYWDELSGQMWKEYLLNRQNEAMYSRKLQIWREIFYHLHFIVSSYQFFMVGSSMGGFATKDSDMDVCLIVKNEYKGTQDKDDNNRKFTLSCLEDIKCCFECHGIVSEIKLIQAKVPILRFRITGEPRFYVDMNCNNPVSLQNSHLLINYSRIDPRVQPLALIIKLWAQKNNINSAFHKTLSSYTLTLLVINFLQCGVYPPVLPSIQKIYPTVFCQESGFKFQSFNDLLPRYISMNKLRLSDLLLKFFSYYDNFDFSMYAISVRLGCLIQRPDTIQPTDEKGSLEFIYVEEPFLLTNTASAVHNCCAFQRIKRAIHTAFEQLKSTRSLYSIL